MDGADTPTGADNGDAKDTAKDKDEKKPPAKKKPRTTKNATRKKDTNVATAKKNTTAKTDTPAEGSPAAQVQEVLTKVALASTPVEALRAVEDVRDVLDSTYDRISGALSMLVGGADGDYDGFSIEKGEVVLN